MVLSHDETTYVTQYQFSKLVPFSDDESLISKSGFKKSKDFVDAVQHMNLNYCSGRDKLIKKELDPPFLPDMEEIRKKRPDSIVHLDKDKFKANKA